MDFQVCQPQKYRVPYHLSTKYKIVTKLIHYRQLFVSHYRLQAKKLELYR